MSERFRKILDATALKLSEGKFLPIQVSQGISNVPANNFGGKTFDDLFTEADRALYQSKRKGGNSISHFGETQQVDLDSLADATSSESSPKKGREMKDTG